MNSNPLKGFLNYHTVCTPNISHYSTTQQFPIPKSEAKTGMLIIAVAIVSAECQHLKAGMECSTKQARRDGRSLVAVHLLVHYLLCICYRLNKQLVALKYAPCTK